MANKTIIVMSDSHGDREIINDIKTKYQGEVDAIFHNGDSELPSSDTIWEGIKVVRGNCDYDNGYPERLITYLGDVVVAQTHGHLYNINFTWEYCRTSMIPIGKKYGVDAVFALTKAEDIWRGIEKCLYGNAIVTFCVLN